MSYTGPSPRFPVELVALANLMRVFLMKAAHAAMDGATYRKSGSQFTIRIHRLPSRSMSRRLAPICRALHTAASALLLCLAPAALAQPQPVAQNGEAGAARAFEQARRQGPLALYAFLHDMPKGADLHTHLAGAVYAESFIRQAVEDNLCVNSKSFTLYKTTATTRSLPPQPVCGEEGQPASD